MNSPPWKLFSCGWTFVHHRKIILNCFEPKLFSWVRTDAWISMCKSVISKLLILIVSSQENNLHHQMRIFLKHFKTWSWMSWHRDMSCSASRLRATCWMRSTAAFRFLVRNPNTTNVLDVCRRRALAREERTRQEHITRFASVEHAWRPCAIPSYFERSKGKREGTEKKG